MRVKIKIHSLKHNTPKYLSHETIKYNPYATVQPINEGTSYIQLNLLENAGNSGGKLKPHGTESTRLHELSLMNSTYFGAIHYDNLLALKLDYTISRIFQEMSLSELETLHQLCELERTQILQPLALAVLNLPYAGHLLSGKSSNFLHGFILAPKRYHHYMFLKINVVRKEFRYSIKIKVQFVDTLSRQNFGILQSHLDQKTATTSHN